MPTLLKKIDWYLLGGSALALWAAANTYVDIARYGVDQGYYWWFCNLALIGVAVGLLLKQRDHLIGWLSIACFTQSFWVIDNMYRVATGENLFGLVEFMYQPGLPLDEFILSHYHYFTIPLSLLGIFYLPKRSKSNAVWWIVFFNPFIFSVSYFAFPATQNINCIHEPCFPDLQHLAGPIYSVCFWLFVYAGNLLIGWALSRFFDKITVTSRMKEWARGVFAFSMMAAVSIASWDTHYKQSLPSFRCAGPTESNGVELKCGFTLDYKPNIMMLSYTAYNKANEAQVCTTTVIAGGQQYSARESISLKAQEKRKLSLLINYPRQSVVATLRADCLPLNRSTASDPNPK